MSLTRERPAVKHLLMISLFLAATPLIAQEPTPAGSWTGTWDSPNGSVYTAVAQFTVATDGSLDGAIKWTLKDTRRADLAPKMGQQGTEYVRGAYDGRCRVASFAGYKLDDPQHILGMDTYWLILAPNGQGFGGVTANGDRWTGMFSLRR